MAQHDYSIANGGGAAVRSDINDALQAIITQNSGPTEPTVTRPYMLWNDTAAGALKIRNATDTAWILFTGFVLPNGGNELGMRNRIINGGMNVWQRGTSRNLGASVGRITDMYLGFGGVFSQSSDIPPNSNCTSSMYMEPFAGSSIVQQRIENINCADLAGTTITVSFWYKSSQGTESLELSLFYPSANNNWGSSTQISSTQSFASPSTSWTRYTRTFTNLPAEVVRGLQVLIRRANSGTPAGYLTGLQLEVGSVATQFDYRTFATELELCQRYYVGSSEYCFSGYAPSTNSYFQQTFTLPVPMRALPTLSLASFSGSTNVSSPGAAALNMSKSVAQALGSYAAVFGWTAPLAGYTAYNLAFEASAEI